MTDVKMAVCMTPAFHAEFQQFVEHLQDAYKGGLITDPEAVKLACEFMLEKTGGTMELKPV